MFEMFPADYGRSLTVNMALRAGLEVGEIVRAIGELARRPDPSSGDWSVAWNRLAAQHVDLAEDELDEGFRGSAGDRMLRASVASFVAQTRLADRDRRLEFLKRHWDLFERGVDLCGLEVERVDVPSETGTLAGLFIPAATAAPAPCVIFYPGFDLDKEMILLSLRDSFRRRGVGLLVLDGPGIGETLWLRGIPSRPDYEVPTAAAMEILAARDDTQGDRIGVAGISLGGYYATRAAACEPRLACCAAWGGILNFGRLMKMRWALATEESASELKVQLPAVMGTKTIEEAIDRVQAWDLEPVLGGLHQPFLLLHGELDRQTPLIDAKKVFRLVPSGDKQMRIYTAGQGGAQHCQVDEPRAARELLADWCAIKLSK